MSDTTQTLPDMTPAVAMIRTLGLIAAICGLIIVAAYQGTYDQDAQHDPVTHSKLLHSCDGGALVPWNAIKVP